MSEREKIIGAVLTTIVICVFISGLVIGMLG